LTKFAWEGHDDRVNGALAAGEGECLGFLTDHDSRAAAVVQLVDGSVVTRRLSQLAAAGSDRHKAMRKRPAGDAAE